MKRVYLVSAMFVLILFACKKEEPVNLEAFSPQGFAYDLGDLWEVNATVRIKGFQQNINEETKEYSAAVFYKVDLEKPDGGVAEDIYKFLKKVNNHERLPDIGLEAQFELSSDHAEGIYKLIYNIKDELSGMQTVAVVEVELQK